MVVCFPDRSIMLRILSTHLKAMSSLSLSLSLYLSLSSLFLPCLLIPSASSQVLIRSTSSICSQTLSFFLFPQSSFHRFTSFVRSLAFVYVLPLYLQLSYLFLPRLLIPSAPSISPTSLYYLHPFRNCVFFSFRLSPLKVPLFNSLPLFVLSHLS